VASARRRDLVQDRARAEALKAELVARGPALLELAARCRDKIAGAPRLAVPDPTTLGPVPEDRLLLDAYAGRLELVRTALDTVEAAYGAPLTEREDLRGVVKAFQAKAMAARVVEQADLLAAWKQVQATLWTAPCDLAAGRRAVAEYTALVRSATGSRSAPPITESWIVEPSSVEPAAEPRTEEPPAVEPAAVEPSAVEPPAAERPAEPIPTPITTEPPTRDVP
jgi:hypothetical protein